MSRLRLFTLALAASLVFEDSAQARPEWREQESDHFTVLYREPYAYLVPHILRSAETALSRLAEHFDYRPSEKILITTFDFSDHGTASATTTPHNRIQLEVAPFELAYETTLFHERIQWLMNHELVHIVVNDQASKSEAFGRSLFSKVPPEPEQPLSIVYSFLSNRSRYTPRWHQEGIAVFLETWLSGGFGRGLGSFDEMYFRSLVLEEKPFPSRERLEATATSTSFLLDTLHYLYGARFATYLAAAYGVEPLLDWYREVDAPASYETRFARQFGSTLAEAWDEFVTTETRFQRANLAQLGRAPVTPIEPLFDGALGWVSQPSLDRKSGRVLFGSHRPNELASIQALDLASGRLSAVATLPSPGLIQVASTTFDPGLGLVFFTTNNKELYRDIRTVNVVTGDIRMLFEDARVGQLTVSPQTHELWGVRHSRGLTSIVRSPHPYRELRFAFRLGVGDTLAHLAISPQGRFLAATLHRSNGNQSIVLADLEASTEASELVYDVITEDGSPEFPSWSPDETFLYWNAYTNGVSNVYRYNRTSGKIEALSHALRGLFRPIHLDDASLFAFEFTSEGFSPVRIPNRPAADLPATRYFGETAFTANPELAEWSVGAALRRDVAPSEPKAYRSWGNVRVHSLLPVVSGFMDKTVVGIYGHLADPMARHDVSFEAGASPFGEDTTFHFRGAYKFQGTYQLDLEINPSSFYDLFNERKQGWRGTRLGFGHTRFWKFDDPHKVIQNTQMNFFSGIDSIQDNLVAVSTPDMLTFDTTLSSRNTRRSIGSVDTESGNAWSATFRSLAAHGRSWDLAAGLQGEWDRFTTVFRSHNVLHTQFAGGYMHAADDLEVGRFYFGGFGNQYVERQPAKQYRQALRFPGVPYSSLSGRGFAKLTLEHNLPPIRFDRARAGGHFLSHIDASWFTQGLALQSKTNERWINLGGQVNLLFRLWSNLESTVSFGVARAWGAGRSSNEWFISLKLLRS